jgi:hypothetical protein
MQEEGDTAGWRREVDWGEEVDVTNALPLQITCVSRHNMEDVEEDAAMAVLYPRPQVTARSHHQHNVRTWNVCYSCGFNIKDGPSPSHAPQRGADSTTQKDSSGLTQMNTLIKGGIHAPNRCTKQNSRDSDEVGWRTL